MNSEIAWYGDATMGQQEFAQLIRARRIRLGLTQEQVFKPANISKSYYSYLEKGKRQAARNVVLNIAGVLEIPEQEALEASGWALKQQGLHLDSKELEVIALWRQAGPLMRRAALRVLRTESADLDG